ncbi:hypothetical protein HPB50_004353 [Hyalomma asiaticum]|uniref:Uncharacterized protein n=1 Tax=Hyalomma asiaticum TaxID=266040 RepID=A0ACB7T8F8_HYAAI|nr:hypothetical protein HPB50_004353 [Hyalomma asiaticum]
MPTANRYLDGQPVTVLRDSGCNTVVVGRLVVSEKNFAGIIRNVYFLDCSSKQLPEAKALCIEKPLYDVVLGSIDRVLFPSAPTTSHDLSDDTRLHKGSEPAEAAVRCPSVSPESTTLPAARTRGTKETKLAMAASNAVDKNRQIPEELQREDRKLAQCSPGLLDEREVLPGHLMRAKVRRTEELGEVQGGRGSEVPGASVRAPDCIKGRRAVSSRTQRCSRLGRGRLVPDYRTRAVPGGVTLCRAAFQHGTDDTVLDGTATCNRCSWVVNETPEAEVEPALVQASPGRLYRY